MAQNHVSVRLDAATLARIDALIPHVSTQRRSATRSDALRQLILSALDHNDATTGAEVREASSDLPKP